MKNISNIYKIEKPSRQGTCIEFFSACQSRDPDAVMQLCAVEAQVNFLHLGQAGRGIIKRVSKAIWVKFMGCFPELDYMIKDLSINSNESITCQVQLSVGQMKNFANIPGKVLIHNNDQVFIFHFNQQNKISRIFIYGDYEKFACQLEDPLLVKGFCR